MTAPHLTALKVAAALCRGAEGFEAAPYLCPAGVASIGYGTTRYPDGRAVSLADAPLEMEQAEWLLIHDLRATRLPAVLRASPGLARRPWALGAMLDFAYNLGTGAYAASTLRRRVDAADWPGARVELMRWVHAGGRRLPGLVKRRAAEAALLGDR